MLEVKKPKHLSIIPSNIKTLTLKEDTEFENYLGSWKSLSSEVEVAKT